MNQYGTYSKINSPPWKFFYGIQPVLIHVYAKYTFSICKHFDPSVVTESRYYKFDTNQIFFLDEINRVYDLNDLNDYDYYGYYGKPKLPIVKNSCIGEFPGKKLDQCYFNGYLEYNELCNPCEKKEFKEQCDELCKTTTGPPFGAYDLR